MRQKWWLGMWAIGLALGGASLRAQAQTCAQDSDCGRGFSCQITGASTCPAFACAPGEKCEQPGCDPVVYRECRPGPCSSDTDCSDGMVCYAAPVNCAAIAVAPCPPGQTCPEVTQPECSAPPKMCTPRYVLPCQQASDCGATGWECKAVQECSCSGSGGSGTATPGIATPPMQAAPPVEAPAPTPATDAGTASSGDTASAPLPEKPADLDGGSAQTPPSCECHDSATKQCQALEIDCNLDADCPADFTCQHFVAPRAGSGSCTGSRDGGVVCTEDPTPPPQEEPGQCWPKYGGAVRSAGDSVAVPTVSPTTPGAQGTNSSDPVGQPGSVTPPTTHGGAENGEKSSPADAGTSDDDPHTDVTPLCSVRDIGLSSSPGSSFAMLMAAFALSWQRRRRQR